MYTSWCVCVCVCETHIHIQSMHELAGPHVAAGKKKETDTIILFVLFVNRSYGCIIIMH
jgi:hypothetical protein